MDSEHLTSMTQHMLCAVPSHLVLDYIYNSPVKFSPRFQHKTPGHSLTSGVVPAPVYGK